MTGARKTIRFIPHRRIADVLFDELIADEFVTVKRIYDTAGLELTDEQRCRMTAFLDDHARGKNRRIAYDLRADVDIDPTELRTRFAFYGDRLPVTVEVQ